MKWQVVGFQNYNPPYLLLKNCINGMVSMELNIVRKGANTVMLWFLLNIFFATQKTRMPPPPLSGQKVSCETTAIFIANEIRIQELGNRVT